MSDIFDLFRKISAPAASATPLSYVIAGLGNPGTEYENTRHNVGFAALDFVAAQIGARIDRARFDALCGEGTLGGQRVLLLKPQTYMNLSGRAVGAALSFYKLPPGRLIVLCDDVSFDVGRLRIRLHGSHGGHNGLRNITEQIGSENFPRLKIGVGKKPRPDYDLADWVLGRFPADAAKPLAAAFADVAAALPLLLSGKSEEALCRYSH